MATSYIPAILGILQANYLGEHMWTGRDKTPSATQRLLTTVDKCRPRYLASRGYQRI